MSKRTTKKDKGPGIAAESIAQLLDELRLDPAEWRVDIDYTKGALSGQRGAVVLVQNLRTGESAKASGVARTKNDARSLARDLARDVLTQLLNGRR